MKQATTYFSQTFKLWKCSSVTRWSHSWSFPYNEFKTSPLSPWSHWRITWALDFCMKKLTLISQIQKPKCWFRGFSYSVPPKRFTPSSTPPPPPPPPQHHTTTTTTTTTTTNTQCQKILNQKIHQDRNKYNQYKSISSEYITSLIYKMCTTLARIFFLNNNLKD